MRKLKPNRGRRGFSLVEIVVTIAVLSVILAIALPNLVKLYMVGNEAAVMEAMRAVVQANESYRMREQEFNRREYAVDLAVLAVQPPRNTLPYLDGRFVGLTGGAWRGYRWSYAPGAQRQQAVGNMAYSIRDNYALRADPVLRGINGQRSFYVDPSGVLRFNSRGPAGPADPSVEQTR